jgi:lysozyme
MPLAPVLILAHIIHKKGLTMNTNKLAGGTLLAALALAAAFEGTRYEAYPDVGGVWTVCQGATKGVKPGDVATPEQCQDRLVIELLEHAKPLERIPYPLPDNVVLAWADFCYNVGTGACSGSTGYRLLSQGRVAEACAQILRWRFTAGRDCFLDENAKVCGGIKKRRQLEYKLCAGHVTIAEALAALR